MSNEQLLEEPMRVSEVRLDHPQQIMGEIAALLGESADAVARLRDRIARLADQITCRFAAEERSGRYEDALCQAPWLTARAQELQQQHAQLVEALDGIRRLCEADGGPLVCWQRVQEEFEDFSDRLREHEAAEVNLLEELHPGPGWVQE